MTMTDQPIPRVCLMGHPVAHSRSPMLHGYWLKEHGLPGSYELVDLLPAAFPGFVAEMQVLGFVGGNVTVPHKQTALRLVAKLDAAAEAIGAVNTIWTEGGQLVGGNTDAHGFIANLDDRVPGWQQGATRAVILGAGGAARAGIHSLRGRGLGITLINRTRDHAEALAGHFGSFPGPPIDVCDWSDWTTPFATADLLVNTTSLGMLGKPAMEIDLSGLKPSATVYDMVYVPLETGLLRAARARGHRGVDGLGMLLHQAVPGFAKWFGVVPTVTPALRELIESDIRAKTPGA